MKTTLTILSFLLLTLATTSFPGAVDAQDSEESDVVDIHGNKVLRNTKYYIDSPFPNSPVIASASISGNNVVFTPFTIPIPYPAAMSSPFDSNDTTPVSLDTILNFKQVYYSPNNTSTTWGVFLNPLLRQSAVAIGGDESYYFKLAKFEGNEKVYELLYCPTGRYPCQCTCVAVGYQWWRSVMYMTPGSGQPLPIAFRPVIESRISPIV